jgi:hypothetical protein
VVGRREQEADRQARDAQHDGGGDEPGDEAAGDRIERLGRRVPEQAADTGAAWRLRQRGGRGRRTHVDAVT